jgi:predicted TIM-barrel fold metal-dependent hydrolase
MKGNNGEERGSSPGDSRYIVISADGHDSPPNHLEKYTEYFPSEYRPAYVEWLTGAQMAGALFGAGPGYQSDDPDPFRRWTLQQWIGDFGIDETWAHESLERYWPTEPPGLLDPLERVAAVETQGIAAELLITYGVQPGEMSARFGRGTKALERAANEAHMRWLADYCGAVHGRLAAPIEVDGHDLRQAIADMRWARELGLFGGVFLPTPAPVGDPMAAHGQGGGASLPPYVDEYWEPFWSACADLALPLVIHIGQVLAPDMETAYGADRLVAKTLTHMEVSLFARRPFWQLIASGAFDRHPSLKLCFVECPVAAIASMLFEMDHLLKGFSCAIDRKRLRMLPSEYWHAHGFAGASLITKAEAARRHEVGVPNLMFGADYPHPEGTWPHTLAAQKHIYGGVPEPELRAILAENAARCFGFDLTQLRSIADRVGPTVEQLSQPLPEAELPAYATSFAFH